MRSPPAQGGPALINNPASWARRGLSAQEGGAPSLVISLLPILVPLYSGGRLVSGRNHSTTAALPSPSHWTQIPCPPRTLPTWVLWREPQLECLSHGRPRHATSPKTSRLTWKQLLASPPPWHCRPKWAFPAEGMKRKRSLLRNDEFLSLEKYKHIKCKNTAC